MRINLWWSERRGEGRFSSAPTDYGNILFINARLGLHCFPSTICFSIVLSSPSHFLRQRAIWIRLREPFSRPIDCEHSIKSLKAINGNGNCPSVCFDIWNFYFEGERIWFISLILEPSPLEKSNKKNTNSNLFQSRTKAGIKFRGQQR